MSDSKWLVISHSVSAEGFPCPDGFAAVWVVAKYLTQISQEFDCVYIMYDAEAPDTFEYQNVILTDVIVSEDTLKSWLDAGKNVLAIDHHRTAESIMQNTLNQVKGQNLKAFFDLKECAATLAWKVFFGDQEMPAFLEYIRDRDNWDELLPYYQEIHAGMNKLGRDFSLFDNLEQFDRYELVAFLKPIGEENAEKRRKTVERLAKKHWIGTQFGQEIPMVMLSKSYTYLTSDIGSYLCKKYPDMPFTAIHKPTDQKWSYRSNKYGANFDVEQFVRQYGGGGHLNSGSWRYERVDEVDGQKRYIASNGMYILSSD